MPDAVTYKVTTYYKLARDEHGLTSVSSTRLDAAAALGWVMDELDSADEDAWSVTREDSAEPGWDVVTIKIDWSKVPDSIRAPKIPQPRR